MGLKLLDLFCGAGGASMGYHLAGFDVTGVDIEDMPRYPFEFHKSDALEFLKERGHEFDAIAASPPCHDHTSLKSRAGENGSGWLLEATRDALIALGQPWVLENVAGAPLRKDFVLCGGMFGLRTYRHRWFELYDPMFWVLPEHPKHRRLTSTFKRPAQFAQGMNISVTGDVGRWVGPAVMGIDWMNGAELSQAIPPAYTQFIGEQLRERIVT